ncbi:kinesin motor domain-containing protein [Phycomyces nitens]|nr:kinesin motor domain-containing protein [Phycomyces nitens]
MAGYSGTVFAYGQTASGKTYGLTIELIVCLDNGNKAQPGVIPRAVNDVFNYISEDHHGREYLLRVSYLEIYNERIRDLLGEDSTGPQPEIHEDAKRGVYVHGLNETIVTTPEQVMQIIKKGEGSRKVSATEYNKRSSRSHTMFQLVIESKSKDAYPVDRAAVQVSQLNLIDLAGSEKVTKDSERQKEGSYINKSLLTLGTVISKLTSGQTATHIPFRDSKLTRILQTALSGNARISIICTVNPTRSSKEESLSTLRFAERAKLVKTAAKMTKITEHSELQNCLKKIEELQTKMQEKTEASFNN